jgi:hypothetical protein
VGWCNGPCTGSGNNPLPTLDGLRCVYEGDCGPGVNGRCSNNCLYKDCNLGCNDEGPNDGGRDCEGTCYGSASLDQYDYCCPWWSWTDQFGTCNGYYGDMNGVCNSDPYGNPIYIYCDGSCGSSVILNDALGYLCGTCNDSSACGEDGNGCLYTNCDQTCTSATPNPNCGGGNDSSDNETIYRLIGFPWSVGGNQGIGQLIGLPPFIKL